MIPFIILLVSILLIPGSEKEKEFIAYLKQKYEKNNIDND